MTQIRPIALAYVCQDDRILVGETFDPARKITFYRPLGGGIEVGETSQEAALREFQEELGQEIHNLHLVGVFESIFTAANGNLGHEIVFIYQADFRNLSLYDCEIIPYQEDDGTEGIARWMSLGDFSPATPLYPVGFHDYLLRTSLNRT